MKDNSKKNHLYYSFQSHCMKSFINNHPCLAYHLPETSFSQLKEKKKKQIKEKKKFPISFILEKHGLFFLLFFSRDKIPSKIKKSFRSVGISDFLLSPSHLHVCLQAHTLTLRGFQKYTEIAVICEIHLKTSFKP